MKLAEMRELNADELSAQITAAQKELFESRFKHSMHQLDDTDSLRRLRHRVAQLKTLLNQKASGESAKPAKKAASKKTGQAAAQPKAKKAAKKA